MMNIVIRRTEPDGNTTIDSDTTGSFAAGNAEVDFDKYVQYRQLSYIDVGGGLNFSNRQHVEMRAVDGVGQYKQTTAEDQFTPPSTVPTSTFGFTYNLAAPTSALFTPNNEAAFMNPANYNEVYHLNAVDTSMSHLPEGKVEYIDNMDSDATGLGFKGGWYWRDLSQFYYYNQYRLKSRMRARRVSRRLVPHPSMSRCMTAKARRCF